MLRFVLILSLSLFVAVDASAQSRRVPTAPSSAARSAENSLAPVAMYDDAFSYARRRFEEFAAKKMPFSEDLREQTQREAKQLAAKYAAQLTARNNGGEDFYYLGMLQILAQNDDGATEAFKKYLSEQEINAEKAQTSRSFVAVALARKKDFAGAETAFADYLKAAPLVLRERVLVEGALAKNYFEAKDYQAAIKHADAAFLAARPALKDAYPDERLLKEFHEAGITVFEALAQTKQNAKAVTALENMRESGAITQSISLYLSATDKLIPYLIEIGRKPEALQTLKAAQENETDFRDLGLRSRVKNFLRSRERHYKLLGETAPELSIDRWIAKEGEPNSLAAMRGKVVLLDFWATWCKPCFAAFPELTEWHQTYGKQGLQIVGVTRYYGVAKGLPADETNELTYLQQFKRAERLPYSFAVAKSLNSHRDYYAAGLPTTILIDKKGVVRYAQTGVTNEPEVQKIIEKLLAEN